MRIALLLLSLVLVSCSQRAADQPIANVQPVLLVAQPHHPSDAYIAFESDDRYGFLDRSGQVVVAAQFDYAGAFSEALAPIRLDGLWGYVDDQGQLAIAPQYGHATEFSHGLGFVLFPDQDLFGFIDRTGKIVIEPKFDGGGAFHNGLAAVSVNGKTGYINLDGEFVIAPQYDGAENFHEGLARSRLGGFERHPARPIRAGLQPGGRRIPHLLRRPAGTAGPRQPAPPPHRRPHPGGIKHGFVFRLVETTIHHQQSPKTINQNQRQCSFSLGGDFR